EAGAVAPADGGRRRARRAHRSTGGCRQRERWRRLTEGVTRPLEVLTVGRISVDLYAEEMNLGWNEVTPFVKSIGGSPTNVAVAAAPPGHRAAALTKGGSDPFGGERQANLPSVASGHHLCAPPPPLRS